VGGWLQRDGGALETAPRLAVEAGKMAVGAAQERDEKHGAGAGGGGGVKAERQREREREGPWRGVASARQRPGALLRDSGERRGPRDAGRRR
jgi:hypothetical protein